MHTLEEGIYSSIDTISDFFKDQDFIGAVEKYRKKMIDTCCEESRYDGYTFGDILRDIFGSDENQSPTIFLNIYIGVDEVIIETE